MNAFPCQLAHRLAQAKGEERWLVEGLWSERAVGIVGGEPKCFKSFLALDMAVSVASGRPFLRRFSVHRPGPVLVFAAEDPLHVVRARLLGIACAAGVVFEQLDVHVITAPRLRLDQQEDRGRLRETVALLRPRLLVLDPFVRLHRIDENVAADVAPLLESLRALERSFELAVVLVHHARKGAGGMRGGQALRGSSELHAWGDSNLYLRRRDRQLLLSVEHRAAASRAGELALELVEEGDALALRVIHEQATDHEPPAQLSAQQRVLQALDGTQRPMTARELRSLCRMRTSAVTDALSALIDQNLVQRDQAGYRHVQL
jgi:hypothetical protein